MTLAATNPIKRLAKHALGKFGYSVRDVGIGVAGVDLLHDARVLIGNDEGQVLFDVGANIGQTTLAMLATFRTPRVYVFEPSPATADALRRVVGNRSNVMIEAVAMGDTVGTLPFHVTADHSVNDSLLKPVWKAGEQVVQVPVNTVDMYCERAGVETISLLKIDTQGYDLRVLQGACRMLGERRIKLYSCETNFERMYDGQATLRDLLVFADDVGYRLVGFYEQTYVNNRLSYLDALFVAR
jgi:FkbM family methyltransferase